MSQYVVKQDNYKYVFGWDVPLNSYFLQVHDLLKPKANQIIAWLGSTSETRMYEVEHLVQAAGEHGLKISTSADMELYLDKDDGR